MFSQLSTETGKLVFPLHLSLWEQCALPKTPCPVHTRKEAGMSMLRALVDTGTEAPFWRGCLDLPGAEPGFDSPQP